MGVLINYNTSVYLVDDKHVITYNYQDSLIMLSPITSFN